MKSVAFIACEEYFNGPSGGGNDIVSDCFCLNKIGFNVKLLVIDLNGVIRNSDNGEVINPSKILENVIYFSGFLSAERLYKKINPILFINKKIINIKDVHFFRELRFEMLTGINKNHDSIMKRELLIYQNCDLVLSYNERESSLLKLLRPNINIHTNYYFNPNFKPINFFNPIKRLVFVGNFDHYPNLDAINTFVIESGDFLLSSGFYLEIFGPGSLEKINIPEHLNGVIIVKGMVNSSIDIYRDGGIFLAPIRFGSGIKIKIIEAALCHLPIIARPEAIEGLPLVHDKSVYLYNNRAELSLLISKISSSNFRNSLEFLKISQNAYNSIFAISNPQNSAQNLRATFKSIGL